MDQLALEVSTPKNPAATLYELWAAACEWDGYEAPIGDRVVARRGFNVGTNSVDSWTPKDGIKLFDCRNYTTMMTLWQDGTFTFHASPASRHDFWAKYTFLIHNYAIRKHVWTVRNQHRRERERGHHRFDWINERDHTKRVPYIETDWLMTNVRYGLTLWNNWWVITLVGDEDDNPHRLKSAHDALEIGYRRAQERYDRFERRDKRTRRAPRHELSLRTKHGQLTGDAALDEMVKHVAVYAPMPKEGNH